MLEKTSVRFVCLLLAALARVSFAGSALEVTGTAYRVDVPFPQFQHLWSESWALKDKNGEALQITPSLGAYIQIYVHNTSTQTVAIDDLKFEGVSLNEAIVFGEHKAGRMHPASIYFSKVPKEQLIAAGEPVWWKADPQQVLPGGFSEITVRLRHKIKTETANLEVVGCAVRVPTNSSPSFAGISFSTNLDTIHCYLRGAVPVKIILDAENVTAQTTMAGDAKVDTVPLVIHLGQALARGSFHCFRAIYADGSMAIAGIRAWGDEFVYGMWGYSNEKAEDYLGDLKRHNINAIMASYGKAVNYLSSTPGIRAMCSKPDKIPNPLYYFLYDEPDAHDSAAKDLEPTQRLGSLGQDLVRRSYEFRAGDAVTPQLLNLDNTYKPENWYMYARLADVCCADPYFQEQQRIVWNFKPAWAASFVKPLYVLGVATICNSACAPKPTHFILNSVRHDTPDGHFRYATPAEKTVELFYALGAGAKGFSYWWYTPVGEFLGCGAKDKEAVALWTQIGLLGAQVRTCGPVLLRSCPANVPLETSAKLWTRTLLAGTDTLVLLAVNDSIASDRLGTVVVPLPKTMVTITPPSWLKPDDVFEITPQGLFDVASERKADKLVLHLGQTEVARMIVITSDHHLRGALNALHSALHD